MSTAAPQTAPVPPPAIRCRDLVIKYGDFVAVDGLSLEIAEGECFGLLGPNGAGKTTTVEAFEGLLRPASGAIEILGASWGAGADRRIRRRIGVALQSTQFSEMMTVEETVRLFRSFYDRGREPSAAIALLGLEEKRGARVGKLSGGQKQRLSLACALVSEPEILFLDEPTTGLDPQARLRIWEVVERFVADGGTVLLTTHYMEEAARLCRRVAIVDRGRLVALDRPEALVRGLGAEEVIELQADGEAALAAFRAIPGVRRADRRGPVIALAADSVTAVLPLALAAAEAAGIRVGAVSTHQTTLEDVFVHLTGRGLRDG
jgi:ABC-2 type transport system ATP-binding protein